MNKPLDLEVLNLMRDFGHDNTPKSDCIRWRDADDFPDETDTYLCEVIQRPNDPGNKTGGTSIHPTYVKYYKGWDHWADPPEGYKVLRYLYEHYPEELNEIT